MPFEFKFKSFNYIHSHRKYIKKKLTGYALGTCSVLNFFYRECGAVGIVYFNSNIFQFSL